MLSSRRRFLAIAGAGAAIAVVGAGCSNGTGEPTSARAEADDPGGRLLDGVQVEARRDPG